MVFYAYAKSQNVSQMDGGADRQTGARMGLISNDSSTKPRGLKVNFIFISTFQGLISDFSRIIEILVIALLHGV